MINFVISYLQNVIMKTSAFTGPSSSSNTSSSSSSSSGASRMVALQQGEVVLDIQFQSQMLPDSDTDGDAHNRAIGSFTSPSPQTGTKTVPHSQDQPLGIGVLTTHRVLVFVVQDPSSSPLVVTNSHTHSTHTHSACSGAEATQSRGNHTPLHIQY